MIKVEDSSCEAVLRQIALELRSIESRLERVTAERTSPTDTAKAKATTP